MQVYTVLSYDSIDCCDYSKFQIEIPKIDVFPIDV